MTEYPREDRFIRFSLTMDTVLKRIQRYKNDRLLDYGLKSMHLMPMYCLYREPDGLTAVELAKSCSVDKAFISRVTGELRELGYVEYSDAASQYKKHLHLTDSGKNVMNSVNSIIANAVDKIRFGLSDDELKIFYSVLAAFDNNLVALSCDNT